MPQVFDSKFVSFCDVKYVIRV